MHYRTNHAPRLWYNHTWFEKFLIWTILPYRAKVYQIHFLTRFRSIWALLCSQHKIWQIFLSQCKMHCRTTFVALLCSQHKIWKKNLSQCKMHCRAPFVLQSHMDEKISHLDHFALSSKRCTNITLGGRILRPRRCWTLFRGKKKIFGKNFFRPGGVAPTPAQTPLGLMHRRLLRQV
jgi:hypothetical protein